MKRSSVFWKYFKKWQMNLNQKFGTPISSIRLTVDASDSAGKCPAAEIDRLRALSKSRPNSSEIDKDFTTKNYGKSTEKLVFGARYVVDFIPVAEKVSIKEANNFLKENNYLHVSGIIHPYLKGKKEIPRERWLASLDVEEDLFVREGHS
jgi:hypothetical protein